MGVRVCLSETSTQWNAHSVDGTTLRGYVPIAQRLGSMFQHDKVHAFSLRFPHRNRIEGPDFTVYSTH